MMNKEQKKQYISDMSTQFDKSEAVIVTHYQGLTVSQLDELRKQMREHGIKFKRVFHNTVTFLAGAEGIEPPTSGFGDRRSTN